MVNNSGISQIKKNTNKSTKYRVKKVKCGKLLKTAGKYKYKVYS